MDNIEKVRAKISMYDDEIIKITKEIFCDIDIATLIQCIKFIKEILLCLEP